MATSSAEKEYPAGTILGGKFRVIRTLGVGGMGAVYEVQHELTQHQRALKVLKEDSANAEAKVRLLREASAAGRIGNPHIVETFDAGELDGGAAYVVMELLDGEDLSGHMKRLGRLAMSDLAFIMRQACEGLHAAHEAGIIHRDIKPGNIFLTQREGRTFVKLVDFGVSKFDMLTTDETELTRDGAVIGTPSYMSPEQVRGDMNLDGRVDVYALGVILYVGVTGKRPFAGGSLPEIAIKISKGEYTPMRELRPDLPQEFADVVARAMATEREARYRTAFQLGEALRPFEQMTSIDLGHALTEIAQRMAFDGGGPPSESSASGSRSHARINNPPISMTPGPVTGPTSSRSLVSDIVGAAATSGDDIEIVEATVVPDAFRGKAAAPEATPQQQAGQAGRNWTGPAIVAFAALGLVAFMFVRSGAKPTSPSVSGDPVPMTSASVPATVAETPSSAAAPTPSSSTPAIAVSAPEHVPTISSSAIAAGDPSVTPGHTAKLPPQQPTNPKPKPGKGNPTLERANPYK